MEKHQIAPTSPPTTSIDVPIFIFQTDNIRPVVRDFYMCLLALAYRKSGSYKTLETSVPEMIREFYSSRRVVQRHLAALEKQNFITRTRLEGDGPMTLSITLHYTAEG